MRQQWERKAWRFFLDCRDLIWEMVPIKMGDYKLVIANTNKKRSLGEGKYNERRSECEKGVEYLKKAFPDIKYLREISTDDFIKHKDLIEDEVVKKRVEHVVFEDERVIKAVEVLKNNDLTAFGELMNASHDSLQDLYEVTGLELDTLVMEARKIDGVLGSRMTGAGFGGCTVSLVREDKVQDFIDIVGEAYKQKIGYAASFYITETGDGGREINITG